MLAPPQKLPQLIKEIGETKRQKELLGLLRIIFRDALLLKMQSETRDAAQKAQPKTAQKAPILLKSERENLLLVRSAYALPALLHAQTMLSEAEKQVKFNAVFPQCLEILLAGIQAKNKE